MLREIRDNGSVYEVSRLEHLSEFNLTWLSMTLAQRDAIEAEINQLLDNLVDSPNPNWGSITNTSLEGGKPNPETGEPGNWTGTPFGPIFEACGENAERAGMFFGNAWKKVIIDRPEEWIGIRFDPTFPKRGITLMGKTYFRSS